MEKTEIRLSKRIFIPLSIGLVAAIGLIIISHLLMRASWWVSSDGDWFEQLNCPFAEPIHKAKSRFLLWTDIFKEHFLLLLLLWASITGVVFVLRNYKLKLK